MTEHGNTTYLTFKRGGCSSTRLEHLALECSARAKHKHGCRALQDTGHAKVTSTAPCFGRWSTPRALSARPCRPAGGWQRLWPLPVRPLCIRSAMPKSFEYVDYGSRRSTSADPPRSSGPSGPSMRHCRRACAMMRHALTAVAAPAAAEDALAALSPTPGAVGICYHPLVHIPPP